MYEDPGVELAVFEAGHRVLCVASAGDTARVLAANGMNVTAVDINEAQLHYARRRAAGSPAVAGRADRALGAGRAAMQLLGWRRREVAAFMQLQDVEVQRRFWAERLSGRGVRVAFALAFGRYGLVRLLAAHSFAETMTASFDRALLDRLEAGISRFPNAQNPWASMVFTGHWTGQEPNKPARPVTFLHDDIVNFMETTTDRFDAFTFSNILDGPDAAFAQRLLAGVRRSAAPGAVMVLRTLRTAESESSRERARDDRSLLWGGIDVIDVIGAGAES